MEQIHTENNYKGLHSKKTEKIIECFYKVYNTLGFGFLEKVYQRALIIELKEAGFEIDSELPVKVYYKEYDVGDYRADLLVDKEIFLELKANEKLVQGDENQLINYLKATEIELGLLLNFGKKPEIKRKIFTNDKKINLSISV